jgi:membrane associated rhomboid family serine protease
MIPLRDDNPSRTKPVVTIGLIGACVLVFLWQFSLGAQGGQRAIYAFGLIPAVLFDRADLPGGVGVIPPVMTVLSSMFMHGGFMHLAGNMLYLWIFGDNVEDSMGHGRFLAFTSCAESPRRYRSGAQSALAEHMVGASRGLGVLGAYLLLYPNARARARSDRLRLRHAAIGGAGAGIVVRAPAPQSADDAARCRRCRVPCAHRGLCGGLGADSFVQAS